MDLGKIVILGIMGTLGKYYAPIKILISAWAALFFLLFSWQLSIEVPIPDIHKVHGLSAYKHETKPLDACFKTIILEVLIPVYIPDIVLILQYIPNIVHLLPVLISILPVCEGFLAV